MRYSPINNRNPPLKVAETQIWPNLGSGVLLFWIFSQSRVGGSYHFEFKKYPFLTVFPLISAKKRPKKVQNFLARFARRPIFFWGSYYFEYFSNLGSGGLIEGGFLLLIGLYQLHSSSWVFGPKIRSQSNSRYYFGSLHVWVMGSVCDDAGSTGNATCAAHNGDRTTCEGTDDGTGSDCVYTVIDRNIDGLHDDRM